MTAIKVQQERSERSTIDSEDVIATTTAGVIDALEVQNLRTVNASVPTSVRPGRAGLNDPGAVNALVILQAAGDTAFEANQRPRPLVTIPTADLISHTSFKSGSKFVIRVVPTQGDNTRDKNVNKQVISDQALYFDRASLQSTSEVHEERYQLFEAFDSETLFLFGERPKIWSFQFLVVNANKPRVPLSLINPGVETPGAQASREQALEEFMNRWNMDFCDELLRRYDKYYRGSAALRLRARTYMSYEDVLIEATLVGMVASRNSTIPGAANVGITFVVHQRQFMGESLTFGSDATLSELLASEDQRLLISQQISPTSIISSKKSSDQLLAEYAENQSRAQASQQLATSIQNEVSAVAGAGAEAQQRIDVLAGVQVELDAEIAAETDPTEKAILLAARADINNQLKSALSLSQETAQAATAQTENLNAAAVDNAVALSRQQTSEAQLKSSADGDLTRATETIGVFVDFTSVNEAGQPTLTTFRVADESAAALIIAGTDPYSLAIGEPTTQILTFDPGESGWTTRTENVHGASP